MNIEFIIPTKDFDAPRKHFKHPDKEIPICGVLGGYYTKIEIAENQEQVTCLRCRRKLKALYGVQ